MLCSSATIRDLTINTPHWIVMRYTYLTKAFKWKFVSNVLISILKQHRRSKLSLSLSDRRVCRFCVKQSSRKQVECTDCSGQWLTEDGMMSEPKTFLLTQCRRVLSLNSEELQSISSPQPSNFSWRKMIMEIRECGLQKTQWEDIKILNCFGLLKNNCLDWMYSHTQVAL